MQGRLEASENRGQETQKVSSFSCSTALSPHTAGHCLSYKRVHRPGPGPGLATPWPHLCAQMRCNWESALWDPGIWEQGR